MSKTAFRMHNGHIPKAKPTSRVNLGWIVLFGLIFAYPCFQHLFPRAILFAAAVLGAYVVLVFTIANARTTSFAMNPSVAFCVLVPFVFVGLAITEEITYDTSYFLLLVFVCILLSFHSRWVPSAVGAGVGYLTVHAVATLVFFIAPIAFRVLKENSVLSSYPAAWDFRSGITAHYSYNGMYLAMGLIIAATLSFATKRRSLRLTGVLLTLLFGIALILTTKRAPLLFAIAAILLTVWVSRQKGPSISPRSKSRAAGLWGVIIACLVFVIGNPEGRQVFDRIFMDSGDYSSGRVDLWRHALELWQSAPILGIGWGNYRFEWVDGGTFVVSVGAHNVLLQLLAETGVVGALLFLAIYSVALYRTLKMLKGVREIVPDQTAGVAAILLGSFCVQVFFGMYALVGNPLYDSPTFTAYLIAVAASSSISSSSWSVNSEAGRPKALIRDSTYEST